MQRYVTYRRVSGGENQKSGFALDAQERDIQLFLENYSETPYEVLAEFVEVQTGTDKERPPTTMRQCAGLCSRRPKAWAGLTVAGTASSSGAIQR